MKRPYRFLSVGFAFLLASNVLIQVSASGFELAALGAVGVGLATVLLGAAST